MDDDYKIKKLKVEWTDEAEEDFKNIHEVAFMDQIHEDIKHLLGTEAYATMYLNYPSGEVNYELALRAALAVLFEDPQNEDTLYKLSLIYKKMMD